ncbi:MAG: hypothetical protein GY839_10010 [candidate division Zixibacteria bacterium]|nr:hypothetical protein [candidate division Zixibacteria bacterium]
MKTVIKLAALFVTIAVVPISASIINIPADYPTIQNGIDSSGFRDTILVQPGTYLENIVFNGHIIVLGSLFITTGDPSYISSTIIDGGSAHSTIEFSDYESSCTVIAGFTIQNGNDHNGGGVICSYSSPSIVNNIITNNQADNGGGIYSYESDPIITDNTIIDNVANNYGGGLQLVGDSPIVTGNTISGNTAVNYGGGVYAGFSTALIQDNTIIGNESRWGGGISCFHSAALIRYNNIDGNITEYYGAGVFCYYSNPVITNNLITNNEGGNRGGGIYAQLADPIIINSTICGNSSDFTGSGISISDANPIIKNTIIRMNTDSESSQFFIGEDASAAISYSNIPGSWVGDGNIDIDPQFRDPENGDYHLQATACGDAYNSGCIDIGSPDMTDSLLGCLWGLGTDLCDMGAYGGGDIGPFAVITGAVTSTEGSPIWDALVSVVQTGLDDYTAGSGEYVLSSMEEGVFDIHISHWDYYDTLITGVSTNLGDTTILNVTMGGLSGLVYGIVKDSLNVPIESVYVEISIETDPLTGNDNAGQNTLLNSSTNSGNSEPQLLDVVDFSYTDEFGKYEFNITPGTYDISFSHPGDIDTSVIGVVVTPGDSIRVNIIYNTNYYYPGDVNMAEGNWPPRTWGNDVTYMRNYFTGNGAQPCLINDMWASADITGDCQIIGADILRLVNYFRGIYGINIDFCPDSPPVWLTADDVPVDPMENWPNCGGLVTVNDEPDYPPLADSLETDVGIWIGNLDGSPVTVTVGGLAYIDVYIQTTSSVWGANVHIPLGANDLYVSEFLSQAEGQEEGLLADWELAHFSFPFGSPPNPEGWSSQSFVGWANVIISDELWLQYTEPTKILTFAVETVNDPGLAGQTVDGLGIGSHPSGWPLSVGDTTGISDQGYSISVNISALRFEGLSESAFLPGDVNMYGGSWPPLVIGGDVTYLVNYFRGIETSQSCLLQGLWCSADANGDCLIIGSDVTKLVNYFRGETEISYCIDYPPSWHTPDDLPVEAPPGWPNCE